MSMFCKLKTTSNLMGDNLSILVNKRPESRFLKDLRIQDPRKNGRKSRKLSRLAYGN
jgi:hypothetical protein